MVRGLRIALGWILGAVVWAFLLSLALALWAGWGNFTGDALVKIAQSAVASTTAAIPGALLFLALGLVLFHLMGRRASSASAGAFGGLLFVLVSGLAWKFGGDSSLVATVFGLFPVDQFWTQLLAIANAGANTFIWLTGHLLIPIVSGMIGGAVYGAVSGAVQAERRRSRRPAVDFGS